MAFAHRVGIVAMLLTAAWLNVGAADQHSPARPKYDPKPTDFVVVCTLFNGPPKEAKAELPYEPITYDANFVIGARVERVTFGKSPWPAGTLLNFLIHSPTLLLGNRFAGEQFVLTFSPFTPTTREDKLWFAPETRYLLKALERVTAPKLESSGATTNR